MFKARREHLYYMMNKLLTRLLCITLISAMVFAAPMQIMAEEYGFEGVAEENSVDMDLGDIFTDQPVEVPVPEPTPEVVVTPEPVVTPAPEITDTPVVTPEPVVTPAPDEEIVPTPAPGDEVVPTPTPGEGVSPTPTPGEGVSPTPAPGEGVSPTPTPGEGVSPTPTPGEEVSPTPTPDVSVTPTPVLKKVQKIIDRLEVLAKMEKITKPEQITQELVKEVKEIRALYDALTEEEKALVKNYKVLLKFEKIIRKLKPEAYTEDIFTDTETTDSLLSDGTSVQIGTPVYYTNMVSNLHAGKDFYLDSLKNHYQLVFAENFSAVMDEIEKKYKEKNHLTDASDQRRNQMTASSDALLVRNWQDILAIYVFEQMKTGVTEFKLDASSKEDLARIFEEMNPVVIDRQNTNHASYANRHINYYIKKNDLGKEDRLVLKKYTETDCKLLCAVITGAKGFVRQSVGDHVSEERVNVIAAAYSLVGEVGYFWGGKSNVLGKDASWGSAARVTSDGSPSTGTMRAFGLDCSGFVTWAVINGYQNQGMQPYIGDGTSNQWVNANVVSEADAQPGDLVFQRGPEAGSDNHVGIICGQTDAGDWIAVHCSSSKNGVTVGEAYGASFRYIRQPAFYPTEEEQAKMMQEGASIDNVISSGVVTEEAIVTESLSDMTAGVDDLFGSGPTVGVQPAVPAEPSEPENAEEEIFISFDDAEAVEPAGPSEPTASAASSVDFTDHVEVTDTLDDVVYQNKIVSWGEAIYPQRQDTVEVNPEFTDIVLEMSF